MTFLTATLVVGGISFYKYEITHDYAVVASVECDPSEESCFVDTYEGETYYYKVVTKPANSIPACDAWADECEELNCGDGEGDDCTVDYCDSTEGSCYGPIGRAVE